MYKYFFNDVQAPNKLDYEYKSEHSFENRRARSTQIINQYNLIPIIAERAGPKNSKHISNARFLVDNDMTIGSFLYTIRSRLKINQNEAMFLFINNKVIPSNNDKMGKLYNEYKDNDGFLYITFSLENVFG